MPFHSILQHSKKYGLFLLMVTVIRLSSAYAEVIGLDDFPGGIFYSKAVAISTDGITVAGYSYISNGTEAFRWTAEEGMVGLGSFGGTNSSGFATAVSSDGSVIVGVSNSSAFRWTADEGMVALGNSGGNIFSSNSYAVSADGTVVVGIYSNSFSSPPEAFRWTADEGMVGLGFLSASDSSSKAYGVSADGTVIVGTSGVTRWNGSTLEAFHWTQKEGMIGLGVLYGDFFESRAYAVSADGSVVVGDSRSATSYDAFRWTHHDGMVGLGNLPGSIGSHANDITSDGSVIVGWSLDKYNYKAIRWTEQTGVQTVAEWLAEYDVDTNGLRLLDAAAISDNGVIVGSAVNTNGHVEAYLARAGGLLFLQDYLSSFLHVNAVRLLSQKISQQIILQQPFNTLIHKSKLLDKRRSEQLSVLYASNTMTPEMYIDQDPDISQGEWTLYPVISYSKWGDDSLQRAGVGVIYSTPSWYVALEPSTSKADIEVNSSGYENIDGIHLSLSGGLSVGGVLDTPSLDNFLMSVGIATTKQDTEIKRYYLNGASMVFSEGTPNIEANSYFGKLGWIFPVTERVSIMPYLSTLYSIVDLDNYTETGGSFPGYVSTDASRNFETRLGVRIDLEMPDNFQISGWTSWVNLDKKSDNETIITPMGLGTLSVAEEDYDRNWFEIGARANWQVAENMSFNATVSGSGVSSSPADFSVNLALTVGF